MKNSILAAVFDQADATRTKESNEAAEVAAYHQNAENFLQSLSASLIELNAQTVDGKLFTPQSIQRTHALFTKGGCRMLMPLEVDDVFKEGRGYRNFTVFCEGDFQKSQPTKIVMEYTNNWIPDHYIDHGTDPRHISLSSAKGLNAEDAAAQILAGLISHGVVNINRIKDPRTSAHPQPSR